MDGKGRRKFGESVSLAYSSLFTSSVLIHQHSKLKIAGTKKTWYHHLLRSYRCPNPIVLFPPALRRFTLSVQLHYILLFCCSVATVVQQLCMTLAKEFKFVEDVTSNLFYDSEYFVVQNVILAMKSNADDDSLPASHNRVMFTTVEALNTHLATRSYVTGYSLSEDDKAALAALKASPSSSAQPHAYRWALHISALTGKRYVAP